MVTRLFKYEIRSLGRTMLPIWGVLGGIALLTRLIRFFESESTVYGVVFGSAVVALSLGIIAVAAMTVVTVIRRFYTNLYTAEGYLSFTLPVTPFQHISVKFWTAMLFTAASAVVAFAAFCVAFSGELLVEMWHVAIYYCRQMIEAAGPGRFVLYAVEFALIALCAAATFYLLVYACIAVGQMAKKNKILAAVGVYFAYYFATQILGTILIVFMIVLDGSAFMLAINDFINDYPNAALAIGIGYYLAQCAIFFGVTNVITYKKLNLE